MAAPYTPAWLADWNRLSPAQKDALECMYDGPIPHDAICDALDVAPSIEPLIADILKAHGMTPPETTR